MEGCDYKVFLSFRGPDTRTGFTDHLYTRLTDEGVRTYRDEEDLRVGEEIGPDLLGAIEQSKISIPIFSKNYASSKWCLKELAQMVECRKRKGQVIMPIFYDVAPSEVRCPTGGYAKALLDHENKKRVDDESIRKWKAALNEVGGLKGWDIVNMADRHEGQLIKEVVTKVLSELRKASLVGTNIEFPQGNEGRIDNIRSNDDQVTEVFGKIVVSRRKIGKGSNGTVVYEGTYDGRLAAVKRLVRACFDDDVSKEIDILIKSDRHDNIVRYYGVEKSQHFVDLALELCSCSLDDLIQVHSDSSNNSAFPGNPTSVDDDKIKLASVRSMMQKYSLWQADGYPSRLLLKLMRDMVLGLKPFA